jgi:hypothetical protein
MKWLFLFAAVVILSIWLHHIHQRRIKTQREQLKIAEVTKQIMPLSIMVYNQLIEEIRKGWPYIAFELPTFDDLLANSKPLLLAYNGQDVKRLAKRLLNPVVLKSVADFVAHRPDFIVIEYGTLASSPTSFYSQDEHSPFIADVHDPPDWTMRRKLTYDRDNGRCRRCGIIVPLDKCHIHHIVRRARGGGHSIDNLVTLCRDCHGLMPEHERVTGGPFYAHSYRRVLHTKECYHAIGARQVTGSLPILIARGYGTCQKCLPFTPKALWIERFVRGQLSSIVNSLV